MSQSKLPEALKEYGELLTRHDGQDHTRFLSATVDALFVKGQLRPTVDKTLQITDASGDEGICGRVAQSLRELAPIIRPLAPKTVRADLDRLASFFERHENVGFDALLNAVKNSGGEPNAIEHYAARLKDVIGTDNFDEVLAELKQDRRIRVDDLRSIVADAGIYVPPRATKKALFQKLADRHDSVLTVKWKYDFMDGRSAA
ncbi:MAG: hypothetical protein AAFO79_10095 [Pseudomonadota bacterium]